MKAGRECDVAVAEKVMGLDVRGTAFAVYVEGEWSVHGWGESDGWMCYANEEPVYAENRPFPMEAPTLSFGAMEYGSTREQCEEYHRRKTEEWERCQERWGCHYHELDVVPRYSTDISAAWRVVEKLGEMGLYVSMSKSPDMQTWDVRGWNDKTNDNRFIAHADTAPLAICLAALDALGVEVGE